MNKNPHIGHRKRIRQKLLKHGEEVFYDYELVELLLSFAIPFRDVKPIAHDLINRFDDLNGILDAPPELLTQVDGIGENSVALIQLIKALGSRYLTNKCKAVKNISNPKELAKLARMKIGGLKNEALLLLFLDNHGGLIAQESLEYGAPDKILVSISYIVQKCCLHNSKYLAIAHNHPSGICEPSHFDKKFTFDLENALNTVNVILLEHVIVSSYTSFSMQLHKIINPNIKQDK